MNQSQITRARLLKPDRLIAASVEDRSALPLIQLDWLAVTAAVFLFFLIWGLFFKREDASSQAANQASVPHSEAINQARSEGARFLGDGGSAQAGQESRTPPAAAIHFPYDEYWISQGPHGAEYGHMAIDIVAGKDSPIKSPIKGSVSGYYIDQYGNTILILENEEFRVTLMHGDYAVAFGQEIELGQVIGLESNNGYTTDIYGYSCRQRDCGYHTHLNVYDKKLGQNVNPLDVLAN